MDPREIVTGDVRQMAGQVTHVHVGHDGITVRYGDSFTRHYRHVVAVGCSSMYLVSRPMWGDQ
jgi:hypothetical protein